MCDRPAHLRRIALVLALLVLAGPACAEPSVRILDLPFKVRAMRGPRSEVAVSVATSGLLPIARAKADREGRPAGDEESAPIAVVWGEDGGAVLSLENGSVAAKPIGREAVEGLTAAETPRGALPATRRALAGPVSAYLTGRARAPDGGPAAAVLTVRERLPMAVSAEPRPVTVATGTVPAGGEAVFSPERPRVLRLAGRPAFLAVTLDRAGTGGLALIARPDSDPKAAWTVTARTSAETPPLRIAAIVGGPGPPRAATVDAGGLLRLWTLGPDRIERGGDARGYAMGEGDADLADAVATGGTPELALPVMGMPALAVVTLDTAKGSPPRERLRVNLPAPATIGIAALGEGPAVRLVIGLADGRVAVVALDGGRP